MDDLLDVMRAERRLAASDELLRYEIDGHIRALLAGGGNRVGMNVLFLPTGPLQELSLDEGWGDEFCALADRFGLAVRAYGHYCAVCSKLAGTLVVEGNELRRESFTSTLTQPVKYQDIIRAMDLSIKVGFLDVGLSDPQGLAARPTL